LNAGRQVLGIFDVLLSFKEFVQKEIHNFRHSNNNKNGTNLYHGIYVYSFLDGDGLDTI
jgi:hypothetical protein